jgi:hypothetical protein
MGERKGRIGKLFVRNWGYRSCECTCLSFSFFSYSVLDGKLCRLDDTCARADEAGYVEDLVPDERFWSGVLSITLQRSAGMMMRRQCRVCQEKAETD